MNRTEWKALHHAMRAKWRDTRRGLETIISEPFAHGGTWWHLTRRRNAVSGKMETLAAPRVIRDRSPIARAADEFGWARHYKGEARKAYAPGMRPRALQAARACIADARAILAGRSAFHALPA